MKYKAGLLISAAFLALCGPAQAEYPDTESPHSTLTQHPGRVIGNLFVLGTAGGSGISGQVAFLITTDKGHILINSGSPDVPATKEMLSPGMIRQQMQQLGLRYSDVKILLLTHAHFAWFAGHADVRRSSGARVMVMEGDDEAVRSGVAFDVPGVKIRWANPCPVDEVLHDGSVVEFGGMRLVAHRTPGHTPGATTWEFNVKEAGRSYQVVILDSPWPYQYTSLFSGYDLADRSRIPLQGYLESQRTLRELVLRGLKPDITLESHGGGTRIDGPEAFQTFLDRKRLELLEAVQVQSMMATDPAAWWQHNLYVKNLHGQAGRAGDPKTKEMYPQFEVIPVP